jgi:acyl-homoserine-lactone acylase
MAVYRWDGGVRPFTSRTETLKIRQPDGTIKEEALTIRESIHGPVVRAIAGKALGVCAWPASTSPASSINI